jgi:hypothetical protein
MNTINGLRLGVTHFLLPSNNIRGPVFRFLQQKSSRELLVIADQSDILHRT